MYVNKLASVI